MKRLIVGIAVAAMAFCAIGATLEESINAGDYAATVGKLSFSTNTLNYVKTAAQAAACYDAAVAATNYGAAQCAAHVALWYGDKATFERFLDLIATPEAEAALIAKHPKQRSWINIYGQHCFDAKMTGHGYIKTADSKGNVIPRVQSLNQLYPDMMLAWYKKLAAAGDLNQLALIANRANFYVDADGRLYNNKFATWLDADWKALLDSFTPERIATLRSANAIAEILYYAYVKDIEAGDTERTETARLMTSAVMKQYARQYEKSAQRMPFVRQTIKEYGETMLQLCDVISEKMYFAQLLDSKYRTNAYCKQLFPTVLASKVIWNNKAQFALKTGDKDIILDTFLTIGIDADAKNIANVIPVLNGLDVGYRSTDVKQILATINKKYTLKLYDDRDTWEPILSKVRAMMEVVD